MKQSEKLLKGELEEESVDRAQSKNGQNKVFTVLGLALSLLTMGALLAFGYFLFISNKQSEDDSYKNVSLQENENTSSSYEEVTGTKEKMVCDEGWKKYTDSEFGFEFCYPQDWKTEYQQEKPAPGYLNLSVNNGQGYNIDFTFSDETYPQYCVYPDTDEDLLPENNNVMEDRIKFDDYNEVVEGDSKYRWSRDDVWGSQIQAFICKQNKEGIYTTNLDPVYGYFRIPIGETDEEQIEVLEKILQSFRKVEKDNDSEE